MAHVRAEMDPVAGTCDGERVVVEAPIPRLIEHDHVATGGGVIDLALSGQGTVVPPDAGPGNDAGDDPDAGDAPDGGDAAVDRSSDDACSAGSASSGTWLLLLLASVAQRRSRRARSGKFS